MFHIILIILLLLILFKKCNIENFSDKCNDCINVCNKRSSLPYCIDECYRDKKCNKKLPEEYKKYYNLHYNNNYLSHDGDKLSLSKDIKKYIPLKVIKKKKKNIYIQTKLNCFGENDNCNYYLGVKDNKVDFYNRKSIKRRDIKWKFDIKKDKILLKNKNKYLNNKLQLVKGKNNAAQFSVDKLSQDSLLRRL